MTRIDELHHLNEMHAFFCNPSSKMLIEESFTVEFGFTGRKFKKRHSNDDFQFTINQCVKQLEIITSHTDKNLISNKQIRDLTHCFRSLDSMENQKTVFINKNILIRIATFISQLIGNWNFYRNSVLKQIEDKFHLDSDQIFIQKLKNKFEKICEKSLYNKMVNLASYLFNLHVSYESLDAASRQSCVILKRLLDRGRKVIKDNLIFYGTKVVSDFQSLDEKSRQQKEKLNQILVDKALELENDCLQDELDFIQKISAYQTAIYSEYLSLDVTSRQLPEKFQEILSRKASELDNATNSPYTSIYCLNDYQEVIYKDYLNMIKAAPDVKMKLQDILITRTSEVANKNAEDRDNYMALLTEYQERIYDCLASNKAPNLSSEKLQELIEQTALEIVNATDENQKAYSAQLNKLSKFNNSHYQTIFDAINKDDDQILTFLYFIDNLDLKKKIIHFLKNDYKWADSEEKEAFYSILEPIETEMQILSTIRDEI